MGSVWGIKLRGASIGGGKTKGSSKMSDGCGKMEAEALLLTFQLLSTSGLTGGEIRRDWPSELSTGPRLDGGGGLGGGGGR